MEHGLRSYMRDEIAELGPLDYDRLMTPWPERNEEAALELDEE